MKKILSLSVLLCFLALTTGGLLLPISVSYAEENRYTPDEINPIDILKKIINKILIPILLVFAAIMIIVAGYMFVTAAGNPETVAKARHFVIYALVGIIIAVVAYGVVQWVARMVD